MGISSNLAWSVVLINFIILKYIFRCQPLPDVCRNCNEKCEKCDDVCSKRDGKTKNDYKPIKKNENNNADYSDTNKAKTSSDKGKD